ncbi:hypothetical protein RHMOL_Rhmol08G0124400 [Rhododendron molle]|uniref:Uncharacterized protein n=1 Tax=Rhododendron molle TaxID=49168 RepID=A0ACC0MMR5_RHOML|nr:hypothetical protein RHMOL_Rhmol08G0124400 [Rhododendron molle]
MNIHKIPSLIDHFLHFGSLAPQTYITLPNHRGHHAHGPNPKSTCDYSTAPAPAPPSPKKTTAFGPPTNGSKPSSPSPPLPHPQIPLPPQQPLPRPLRLRGTGHEVRALTQIGVKDVTGVKLVDLPPLVSRADPHNPPFFNGVFDLGFSAHLDQVLFPSRFAAEMERTVKAGGVCVVAVEECGRDGVRDVAGLFRKSRRELSCDEICNVLAKVQW